MLAHWLIGRALSSRIGFALVKAYAFRTPHVHLHDLDGTLYMGRWSVVDEFKRVGGKDTKRRTLGSRLLEWTTGYRSIRLHHICRPDHDRDLHNHPFDYRTFILHGCYAEEYEEPAGGLTQTWPPTLVPGYRWVHRGGTATGSATKYHRIDVMPKDGVWTLFCMSRNTNAWGFKVDGQHVQSRTYFRMRGYGKQHRSMGQL
jgi:hypothetical protein